VGAEGWYAYAPTPTSPAHPSTQHPPLVPMPTHPPHFPTPHSPPHPTPMAEGAQPGSSTHSGRPQLGMPQPGSSTHSGRPQLGVHANAAWHPQPSLPGLTGPLLPLWRDVACVFAPLLHPKRCACAHSLSKLTCSCHICFVVKFVRLQLLQSC